jgi:hypothetical protein
MKHQRMLMSIAFQWRTHQYVHQWLKYQLLKMILTLFFLINAIMTYEKSLILINIHAYFNQETGKDD